jgi:hypothetical protein
MFQNAFALFFLSVLIGSGFALWASIRAHVSDVVAVLRGQSPFLQSAQPWTRSRLVRFRSGRRPAFPPVTFSICRL